VSSTPAPTEKKPSISQGKRNDPQPQSNPQREGESYSGDWLMQRKLPRLGRWKGRAAGRLTEKKGGSLEASRKGTAVKKVLRKRASKRLRFAGAQRKEGRAGRAPGGEGRRRRAPVRKDTACPAEAERTPLKGEENASQARRAKGNRRLEQFRRLCGQQRRKAQRLPKAVGLLGGRGEDRPPAPPQKAASPSRKR